MVECENSHVNIRINTTLKDDLKTALPKYGFNSISDFFRACAEQLAYGNRSDFTEKILSDALSEPKPLIIDVDVRQKFFEMVTTKFAAFIAKSTEKQAREHHMDFASRFHEEQGIVLLPFEVASLLKLYYTGEYFTPEIRRAYAYQLGIDYQAELPDTTVPDQPHEVKTT